MEMRQRIKQAVNCGWRSCCFTLLLLFAVGFYAVAQDPLKMCTVSDGRMQIVLSKHLPEKELDNFIAQFDLGHLALKRFIKTGFEDSIVKHGWEIRMNSPVGFMITKPLLGADINDPAGRITFTDETSPRDSFRTVSSPALFGYNRLRNKAFTITDSIVRFFLRNNKEARRVMLAGSFNEWNPDDLPMIKTDSGWIASVKLTPGKYWYKFIVDGNWTVDTDNRTNENDGQGNTNSVFYFTNTVFRLKGYGDAKKVFLAGSFNGWNSKELAMTKTGEGWELPLYLANGTHTYRFVVDKDWVTDPVNPIRLPNEFQHFNSVISIGKPYLFKLEGYTNAKEVVLSGSFNGWRDNELFMARTATGWEIPYVLGSGNYEYKFIVDSKSIADPASPSSRPDKNSSYLVLDPNYTFRLKGFENAKKIFLAGDFNGWDANSLAMKKENGVWVFRVHLSPGKHLYKFVVDGEWILDPGNKLWEQNEHNTGNSVLWIEK
jgi:hypothetical protein